MALVFSACDHKANTDGKDIPAPPPPSKIDVQVAALGSETDLYCGMPLKTGSIADTAIYDSKIYGFCSPECKAEFQKNPGQYVKKK